jgi:hypothetical protein
MSSMPIVYMGLKLGLWLEGKNVDWGCLRINAEGNISI